MALVILAALVLSLLSAGQSAPLTDCDSLTKRVEIPGRDQLLGDWRHIGESTNVLESLSFFKDVLETSWARLTAAEEPNVIAIKQIQKMIGKCFSLTTLCTLANNTLTIEKPFNVVEVLLTTSCPDCLVISFNTIIGQSNYTGLQLLSRRDTVTPAELDEFKKQVKCLNLPDPLVLDAEKGYCPDDSSVLSLNSIFMSGLTSTDMIAKAKEALEQHVLQIFTSLQATNDN